MGNGWFNEQTPTVWNFHKAPWRKRPQVISEVHLTYTDGTRKVIKTGADWLTSTGPVQFDNIHAGATYDAIKEEAGWATAGFNASGWQPPVVTTATAPLMEAQAMPLIGVTEVLQAKSVKRSMIPAMCLIWALISPACPACVFQGKKEPGSVCAMLK
ncbi:alpha-L-rhamnosidase N-terminal domain-containing protein [Niabella defluvii]|nr:alpha-L-rhamnosidase N-terminal domain-containing protein [Niabella sp. I65]